MIRQLKKHEIRVHVNVAPAIAHLSESIAEEFSDKLAEYQVDEFFVDPKQAYSSSFNSVHEAMEGHPIWPQVQSTVLDKKTYDKWKERYHQEWKAAWAKRGNLRVYGDDLVLD